MADERQASQDDDIVSATVWCPRRGWGPFFHDEDEAADEPAAGSFATFDERARDIKRATRED